MGLFFVYAGNKPYVSLAFDTKESSDSIIKKYEQKQSTWFGEDEQGNFNNNPPDYQYQYNEFVFSDFPDLFEQDISILTLIKPDQEAQQIDFDKGGDAALNEAFFPFITSIARSFDGYRALTRDEIFRVGVGVHSSSLIEFWLAE